MKFNLSNTYSIYITIPIELFDVSAQFIREVKNGDNFALASDILSKYLKDINDC